MNNRTKKLNRQNNLLDAQIWEENQEVFTNMICYLRGAAISAYEVEVVRQDLTEMVLSAQSRGESISSLFNGDYQQFCEEVIETLPPKSRKQKLIDLLDMICWGLSILFAINILLSKDTFALLASLVKKTPVNWNISVSIGSLVSIFLVLALANVIVNQIIKNAFSKKRTYQKWLGVVCGAGFLLGWIVIGWFGRSTLFTVNIFAAGLAAVFLFAAHWVLESLSC